MATNRSDPRHEGYKAGGYFGGSCPYPSGSEEALAWQHGWEEGSKRYRGARGPDRHPPARWQSLLKRLRSLVATTH
jgi:hypothetical protein